MTAKPAVPPDVLPVGLTADLLREYGSPLYVYRLDKVRSAVGSLRAELPDALHVYYSLKANPHPSLVAAAVADGFGAEVSSVGEMAAVAAAGVAPQRCLYTGPAKTTTEMTAGLEAGVRTFSVESQHDLDRLRTACDRVAATAAYLVRLNAATASARAGLRMTGRPSQFGVPMAELSRGSELLRATGGTRPVGFHVFSATNLPDPGDLLTELAENVATVAAAVELTGFVPDVVDIGGGFGAPFAKPDVRPSYSGLGSALAEVLDERLPGWRSGRPRVAVETGRYLVAEAGTLLTTVMDVKESGGRAYIICDAGVNALGGMSGIGRLLPPSAQPDGVDAAASSAALVGPLCTPLDVLSRAARVGDARVGDVLAIPNVGAYGLSASLVAFLGRPLPAEVVVDGTDVVAVRRLGLTDTGSAPEAATLPGALNG
ncbi:type III PLP-dependent enzyme [Micromonospora sp. RP3T]|uniref:type III PLP-dependent enzyme n=1 Tax=Micromonospora sp. RP3T TaxID=2135446 RepID=UPI003D70593A